MQRDIELVCTGTETVPDELLQRYENKPNTRRKHKLVFFCCVLVASAVILVLALMDRGRQDADPNLSKSHLYSATEEDEILLKCKPEVAAKMERLVRYKVVDASVTSPVAPYKLIHFIRHGEGYHNVAQDEWREQGKSGEPFDLEQDPNFTYLDPELTPKGIAQAIALQAQSVSLKPELLVVSPLRRATRTGLLAFESQVLAQFGLDVRAEELLHERAGFHTCDKRLNKTNLTSEFPEVDYDSIEEEDPLWSDVRETLPDLAMRGARFIEWLMARPEEHVAVATHSGFLRSLFIAVLEPEGEPINPGFSTGEMRSLFLIADAPDAKHVPRSD